MSNQLNRQEVFDQLVIDEGVKYVIYLDHLGHATFGVGHLVTESDPEYGMPVGTPVSKIRVWEVFEKDLDITIDECRILYPYWDYLPGEAKEILVNMMFNMGRPRLSKFKKMNAAIEDADWVTAAKEGRDSVWYKQVTNRAERLMTRLENVS